MSSIPEEVYFEILSRVPVKSLLTCKYVSKTWFQLISDPSFVKSHLNISIQKNNPSLIFKSRHEEKTTICSISYLSLISSSSTEDLYDISVKLDHPSFKSSGFWLSGSCNGLVCLRYLSSVKDRNLFFCVWNPATTEYKTVPNVPNNQIGYCSFGYDYKAEDYTLICYHTTWMYAYTLRSNSWKIIQIDAYEHLTSGVFVNGSFHCLASLGQGFSKVILSLDVDSEKLVELPLPKEYEKNGNVIMDVAVLEGCLSVLVDVLGQWEVWMMQNYGVRVSWTKRHGILHDKINEVFYSKAIGIFKDDNIMFLRQNETVLYDKVNAIARERHVNEMQKYVESLVSLNTGIHVKERANVKSLKKLMMEYEEDDDNKLRRTKKSRNTPGLH